VTGFALHAPPYLTFAGLLPVGTAGLDPGTALPPPVDLDHSSLGEEALASRGIERLPRTLREATDAFVDDTVLGTTFGEGLTGAIRAVRESELELFDDAEPDQIAAASRWAH
jgi:glutamine synthetase